MPVITGAQGLFSFSSGGDSFTNVDLFDCNLTYDRPAYNTTPYSYLLTRRTLGQVRDVTGTVSAYATSGGAPTIPTGTVGVGVFKYSGSNTMTFKCCLHALDVAHNSTTDQPQVIRYRVSACAESSSDTVT